MSSGDHMGEIAVPPGQAATAGWSDANGQKLGDLRDQRTRPEKEAMTSTILLKLYKLKRASNSVNVQKYA